MRKGGSPFAVAGAFAYMSLLQDLDFFYGLGHGPGRGANRADSVSLSLPYIPKSLTERLALLTVQGAAITDIFKDDL